MHKYDYSSPKENVFTDPSLSESSKFHSVAQLPYLLELPYNALPSIHTLL